MGIRVGIVGIGSFGSGFVRLFRDHPRVDRVALCDIDKDRLSGAAKKFEIAETYDSLDEICGSDLDALAFFTQPWLHAPQVIQAMNAGKHAYSAVPIITSTDGDQMLEWYDKLIEACRRTGQHYMLGETSYYRRDAIYCRRRAAEKRDDELNGGGFGQFVYAQGQYWHDIDGACNLRDVAKHRWGKDWDMSKSGGVPMHYPTHSIGGLLSVLKTRMTEVSCIGQVYPNDDWFREDTVSGNVFANETGLFRCANGAAVRICEYRRISDAEESFELFGTHGTFRHGPGGEFWVTKEKGWEKLDPGQMREPLPAEVVESYERGVEGDVYGGHGGSHAYLIHEFVDAVANDRLPAINAWEAVRYCAPGVMAHKSAVKDGELLKIPDWGDPPT